MVSLPYFLGCPSWNEAAWRGSFYPRELRSADYLGHYGGIFNAVEGNTTFYARPSAETVRRWAETMPAGFRFCAKFPRDISHEGDLRERLGAADDFLELLAPLGERVSPLWLQLSAAFTPQRLGELLYFLDELSPRRIAVEVRHPAFFDKGEDERLLNRHLRERGVERICLDSRALFSCRSDDPAVLHAQSKKPRLPIRPAALASARKRATVSSLRPASGRMSLMATERSTSVLTADQTAAMPPLPSWCTKRNLPWSIRPSRGRMRSVSGHLSRCEG